MASTNNQHKPLVIVISGIIGAGKTTLIALLGVRLVHEGLKVAVVPEPVKGWEESGLLTSFYGDSSRWGYTFQTEAFRSRIMTIRQVLEENTSADVILMERSPWDDKIFMKMLFLDGKINKMEWDLYLKWCDMWDLLLPVTPDLFVLLDPTVDECQSRVKRRGRKGEEGISSEYQIQLKNQHDLFFNADVDLSLSGSEITNGAGLGDVTESMIMLKNLMVPCYHLRTKENFKDEPRVQEKITELFKKIIQAFRK